MSVLNTVGAIARSEGVPVHRVVYVIESRGIKPAGIAGHAKVYDENAVAMIRSELRRIREDRPFGSLTDRRQPEPVA